MGQAVPIPSLQHEDMTSEEADDDDAKTPHEEEDTASVSPAYVHDASDKDREKGKCVKVFAWLYELGTVERSSSVQHKTNEVPV